MARKSEYPNNSWDDCRIKKKRKSKDEFIQNDQYLSQEDDRVFEPNRKKHSKYSQMKQTFRNPDNDIAWDEDKNFKQSRSHSDASIQQSVAYYEKILQSLRDELNKDSKEIFAHNALQESEGKEVALSCHGTGSYCLELLLTECKDSSIMQRFMSAFAQNKISVCTSANASHITETLICYAVKSVQHWSTILNSEDNEEKIAVIFCLNWLTEFGEFALENLKDCLYDSYSCHVVCTLVRALAGDISGATGFMSKNLKAHKQEIRSQHVGINTSNKYPEEDLVVLEEIPKYFANTLKNLYKSLVSSEIVLDSLMSSSSAIVIEALLFALKKRIPKHCKKMIIKLAKAIFSEKNQDNVPRSLLHTNCSFVVDEMFKAADDESQLMLWNQYIVDCLDKVVTHSVGNFVIQRIFDVVQNKSVFETVCEAIWPAFNDILKSQNFGIFVSLATACNRLSAQQAAFMKNIMLCLHCWEPEQRQSQVLPLLLRFQIYEEYIASRESGRTNLQICLQGSLVAQAVLKFHKPLKVVNSMISMAPTDLEFLAGHIQGCHVLNAFFSSISVGEKNKEKLLLQLKPAIISIACDRQKSLTLSRIWILLSVKLKEIIARELAQNRETLTSSSCGHVIWRKFGIHYFKRLQEWREIQTNASYNKKPRK